MEEINKLNAQLAALKMEAKRDINSERKRRKKELGAAFLNDAARMQQKALASVHSAISRVVCARDTLELPVIRLGTSPQGRWRTLKEWKPGMTRQALECLAQRERFVDPTTPFADISRFVDNHGNYCALLFDIVPFEGVQSVKDVYDALKFYYSNMEIRVTEALGDVTIREDDGNSEPGISHCRYVSYLSNGVQLEMNTVICCEYDERRALGVFTENYVDQDDLFPYLSTERLRQDVTVVVKVRAYVQTRVSADGSEEQERLVVLSRYGRVQLHKTDIALPAAVVHELREDIARWGDVMLKAVRELVYHPGKPLDISTITKTAKAVSL